MRKQADIEALAKQQFEMLQALWPLLKTGGVLLYSTCSIVRAENDEVVDRFINSSPDVKLLAPELDVPGVVTRTSCGIQMLPGRADNDGFYYALMEHMSSP